MAEMSSSLTHECTTKEDGTVGTLQESLSPTGCLSHYMVDDPIIQRGDLRIHSELGSKEKLVIISSVK